MNKQDEKKAREISYHYLQQVDCFKKTKYDEDDIISTARDAALEMAAWKEQQMMDTFKIFVNRKFHKGDAEMLIRDFKKAMEE